MPIHKHDLSDIYADANGNTDYPDYVAAASGVVVAPPPPPPPDPIPVPPPPPPPPPPVPVPPPVPPPAPAPPVYRWEKYKSGSTTLYRIYEGATKRVDNLSLTEARWLCGVLKITPP